MAPERETTPATETPAFGRAAFDLPVDEIYLDGAFMSPLPRVARAAVDEAYLLKAQPWRVRYVDGLDIPDRVRSLFGRLTGFPTEEIGLTTGTGDGVTLLAHGLRYEPGERILIGPDEFPSNVFPWLMARERGAVVEFVGESGRPLEPEMLAAALRRPGRVRVVAAAAVHYVTGELHPLDEFARLAHDAGALLAVDGTQAVGAVAWDWPSRGADALFCSGYKWCLGPYGTGAVWMRPDLRNGLVDVRGNWWANAKARDISTLLEYAPLIRHGRRFDTSEAAAYLHTATLRAGLETVLAFGVERIEAHHRALQDRLADGLAGGPFRLVTSRRGTHRSPLLLLALEGADDT
ncbi:MAG: aminotransferase class V-fold PLP-dependent enzyme, partial [Candidatus Rokuibacteriota bacterium]